MQCDICHEREAKQEIDGYRVCLSERCKFLAWDSRSPEELRAYMRKYFPEREDDRPDSSGVRKEAASGDGVSG
jgi:hypothetical protein